MRTDASAKDDLLYLAILATSVVDSLVALREGSSPDVEALNQAKEIVGAVAQKRYYALPDKAFPTSPRQLQTILQVWGGQIAKIPGLIDAALSGHASEAEAELIRLFGKLGRRALRQMDEPVLEEAAAS